MRLARKPRVPVRIQIGCLVLACGLALRGLGADNLSSASAPPFSGPLPLSGDLAVHDPSTIVKCGDTFWLFATGNGVLSRLSQDLTNWSAGPRVFTNAPDWTPKAVPGNRGHFWAPDIIHLDDRYLLYYSVSTWGSSVSAIGLATTPTLDPASPNYRWTDAGMVIQTGKDSGFNAIDPAVTLDGTGRLWMVLGSFWSGIKLVALDPRTGKRADTNLVSLAWQTAIEAACLKQHGEYYYLFVNWGQCCRGVESTYNLRVGRSRSPGGPFVDRAGQDLLSGGGTLLLETQGRFIGPGHAGFLLDRGTEWMSYHYYDGEKRGAKTLGLRPVRWSNDGWPELP